MIHALHSGLPGRRLLIAVAALGFLTSPATAQTKPPVPALEKTGRAYQLGLRKEVDAEMKKLRQDVLNLQRQRQQLTIRQYERREASLLRRRRNIELSARARVGRLNQARAKALRELQDEVVKIVKAISVEKGYTLVLLDQGNVLHHAPQYDITEVVLARLNKVMPKVELEIDPKKKPAPKR